MKWVNLTYDGPYGWKNNFPRHTTGGLNGIDCGYIYLFKGYSSIRYDKADHPAHGSTQLRFFSIGSWGSMSPRWLQRGLWGRERRVVSGSEYDDCSDHYRPRVERPYQ